MIATTVASNNKTNKMTIFTNSGMSTTGAHVVHRPHSRFCFYKVTVFSHSITVNVVGVFKLVDLISC